MIRLSFEGKNRMSNKLDFFYQAIRAKHEYIFPHKHQCYELVYYTNGRGTTIIGGHEYSFNCGDFAIIPPNTMHEEWHERQSEVMFVGFTSAAYHLVIEGVLRDSATQSIRQLMERLAFEIREKKPLYTQMLNNIISELLIELTRTQPHQERDNRDNIILYAQAFIDEYYKQKIDMGTLAAQYGYSYDRFRHLFKEKSGVSPTSYILYRRIEHAKEMLQHSKIQVSSIAMECGFSTDAQFCSLFKRETGMTPGQFRRSSRIHNHIV